MVIQLASAEFSKKNNYPWYDGAGSYRHAEFSTQSILNVLCTEGMYLKAICSWDRLFLICLLFDMNSKNAMVIRDHLITFNCVYMIPSISIPLRWSLKRFLLNIV